MTEVMMNFGEAYALLNDSEKATLYTCALITESPRDRTLARAFTLFLERKNDAVISETDMEFSANIKILQKKQFFTKQNQMPSNIAHCVMLEMAKQKNEKKVIGIVDKVEEESFYYFNESAAIHLRAYLYFNNNDKINEIFLKNSKQFADPFFEIYFLNDSVTMEWILTRPALFQIEIIKFLVRTYCKTGNKTQQIEDLLHCRETFNEKKEYAFLRSAFSQYDLFTVNHDRLKSDAGSLDVESAICKEAHANTLFLFDQNIAESLVSYEDAIKTLRKETGKKQVYLEPFSTYCYILGLFAQKTPAAYKKINTLLKAESAAGRSTCVCDMFENVLNQVQGFKSRVKITDIRFSLYTPQEIAILLLCMYWLDPERITVSACETLFEKYKDTLPLVGKIIAEVVVSLKPKHKICALYLEQDRFKGLISFTSLVAIGSGWELALDSLNIFFGAASTAKSVTEDKAKRLLWLYDIKSNGIAEVLEQSFSKTKWNKGKAVSMKRLFERDRLDFITSDDQKIIKALKRERYSSWGSATHYFEWDNTAMHLAFVGHPNIHNSANIDQQLEFVSSRPELMIKQIDPKNFHIALSHHSNIEQLFIDTEMPTRFRLVHFDESLLPLAEILGKGGVKVPVSAKDHIVDIVQKAGLVLPIHSDVAEIDIQAQDGDVTPCVQLQPLGEFGLEINLLVRPFNDKGPYFRPAHGRPSIQMIHDQQPLRAKRDFDKERAMADDLLKHCKVLNQANDGSDEWQLDDIYDCLETLAELKEYEDNKNPKDPAPRIKIEWPKGKKVSLSEPVSFNKLSLSIKQERDWFAVDGKLKVDDNTVLDLKTVLALLDQSKGRFIQLDGQKYIALTNSLKKQLQELKFFGEQEKNGNYRVHALGGRTLQNFAEQAEDLKTDTEWKKKVKAFAAADTFTPELPSTFQAVLRDYQKEGFEWMSRLAHLGMGACLADDMGLGKTVQTLAVLLNHAPKGPCLVVAPTSVCHNWHEEIQKFSPTLTSYSLDVGDREACIKQLKEMDILICSYTLLQQEIELLKDKKWEMVVLDEAQAIKNATTKRFQAAMQLEGNFKLALSGTPIENNLEELWSLFRFITPGLLGSKESFQKRFLTPMEKEKEQSSRQALKNLIKAFMLRRTKTSVLQELPPKTEQTIHIDMEPEELSFYEAVRQSAIENISSMTAKSGQRKIHILAEITRLRRACCHPSLVHEDIDIPSSKIKVFLELVDELLENNHRALVFSQYVSYLDIVRSELDKKGIDYQYLDGSTPAAERQNRVKAFQEGKSPLFLLSLKAGGAGLNLTAADYVIHMDPWWNPAVEDQASDRAHRIGQQRPVTVYRLVMKNSIEERMLALHQDKRDLADDLLEGTQSAGKLSEEDLIHLMSAA